MAFRRYSASHPMIVIAVTVNTTGMNSVCRSLEMIDVCLRHSVHFYKESEELTFQWLAIELSMLSLPVEQSTERTRVLLTSIYTSLSSRVSV